MYKILIVEDELEICEILCVYLARSGRYETVVAHDAAQAVAAARAQRFDLILLDIVLPGMDGLQLCTEFRKAFFCPIIFLSGLSDDETIVTAMKLGGDDYLVKPFSCAVLEAHIDAVLRRMNSGISGEVQKRMICGWVVDPLSHTLEKGNITHFLSPTEYSLLLCFAERPNQVLSADEIYQRVWLRESGGDHRTVFVHVHNLRKKIEEDPSNPRLIRTVPRGGYMFTPNGSENTNISE